MANKLYVIVFVAILSNAQIISQNENNRYGDDQHGVMLTATAAAAASDLAADAAVANGAALTSMAAHAVPTDPVRDDDSQQRSMPELGVSMPAMPSPSIRDDGFMNENDSRDQEGGVDDALYTLKPPELTAINHFKELSLDAARSFVSADEGTADGFQELSLENGDDATSFADHDSSSPRGHNIYKIARNNKAKMGKSAKILTEAFLSGNNGSIFSHITNLYDQFQWSIGDIGKSVTRKCASEMAVYLNALAKGQSWALQATDSSGRYRGQFLFGNDHWLGSPVFCEELNNFADLEMEYFLIVLTIPYHDDMRKGHTLHVGQCLPKTCSLTDIKNVLSMDPTAVWLNSRTTNKVTVHSVRRVPGDYSIWDDGFFHFFIVIATLFGLLAIIATIYENRFYAIASGDYDKSYNKGQLDYDIVKAEKMHAINKRNGQHFELQQIAVENNNEVRLSTNGHSAAVSAAPTNGHSKNGASIACDKMQLKVNIDKCEQNLTIQQKLLFSFSFTSNLQTIFSVKTLNEESIPAIHGMKVLSLIWVIMAHTYLQLFGTSENKFSRTILERTSFSYQFISNATYAVDTFFFLSGLLVTMLFFRNHANAKKTDKPTLRSGSKQTLLFFIYRYMRLTPAFLVVIILDTVLLKYTYDSAVFPVGLADHTICPNYWWRNILYIHTWYPFNEFCMIWSWYLANDMQYYVWSIIMLITSIRHPKLVVGIVSSTLVATCLFTAYVSFHLNYSLKISEPLGTFGVLYEKPWARIGPYIIGMLTGYLIHTYKSPPKITLSTNALLWFCSIVSLFFVVFGVWNGSLSVGWTAIYVALSHTVWGIGLIWITLSCKWNIAGPINRLLSLRGLLPLSRLTYCAYLIHPVTQIVMSFQLKGTLHLTHGLVLTIFLGNTVFSYLCALVISLLFEAPIVRMLKILFGK